MRSIDETQLQSVEKARSNALEVAQEANETKKARTEDEEAIIPLKELRKSSKGVWGNLVSLRAPVMGMIYVGFADR